MTSCSRCAGLTVSEEIREGATVSFARRCVSCGDIVDPVIRRNRSLRIPPRPTRARTGMYGLRWWRRMKRATAS